MISRDRWERVESVYHAALERDPDSRAAFLDEACGDDVELRSEVDSLMKFDGPAAKFIETPAIELEAKAIAADENSRAAKPLLKEIGPYRLISIISHGGMGDVFLAVDTRLDRKVAIKLLSTEFTADPERILRFKQEARTTSTLSHPNIVTLYEIGEVDGHQYIVTEYVEGATLRQLIARAPSNQIDFKDALSIVSQVVDALNVAHEAGVVHRDIKPENVMVRGDGLVKVLDFGIAKLTAEDSDSSPDHLTTKTGIIMGTASYMSPEQVRGQKVDHRADIFSVGAMLYEMLSGQRPFEGETMADVMAAVLVKEPKPLDTLVLNMPPTLQRIVERCLEKRPEKRFQTASDLAFSLKELSVLISTPADNGTAHNPSTSVGSGKSIWKVVALIAVIAIVVIAVVVEVGKRNTVQNRPSQSLAKPPASGSESTTRLVWFDRSGKQLGTVGTPGQYSGPNLSPTEDRVVVALHDPKRNSRDLWIFPAMSENGLRLTSDPSDELNPVWSPDGRWIIYTSDKNGVRSIYRKLADGNGEAELLLASTVPHNVEDISPNGQIVLFNTRPNEKGEPTLATLSLSDRRERAFHVASVREDAGRFSPDGRWIAYRSQESSESEIIVRGFTMSGTGAQQKWMVSNGRGGNTQPMWRGDGKELYYLAQKTLTSVAVNSSNAGIVCSPPKPLFKVNIEDNERRNRFTVTRDGERFLVIVKEEMKLTL